MSEALKWCEAEIRVLKREVADLRRMVVNLCNHDDRETTPRDGCRSTSQIDVSMDGLHSTPSVAEAESISEPVAP